MERQLDVYEISGFLNAANGMNIYKNSVPNEDCVEIDRAKYLIGDDPDGIRRQDPRVQGVHRRFTPHGGQG